MSGGYILAIYEPKSFYHGNHIATLTTTCVAGFLTGLGTRMANGCTSGHGLVGLARLSPRSLSAVLSFMSTAVLTATVANSSKFHDVLFSLQMKHQDYAGPSLSYFTPAIVSVLAASMISSYQNRRNIFSGIKSFFNSFHNVDGLKDIIVPTFSALAFAFGLGIGGMTNSSKVSDFLNFSGTSGWDYSLMGVLGAGVITNSINMHLMHGYNMKTVFDKSCKGLSSKIKIGLVKENLVFDYKLIIGSALFGVGWGLNGICPGPGLIALGGCQAVAKYFIPALISGVVVNDLLFGPEPCFIKEQSQKM